MSVSFEIKMTPQAIYSFMLHQNYSGFKGILESIFGLGIFMLAVRQAEVGNTISAILLFVAALFVILYPPVLLWFHAKRKIQGTPAYSKPMRYELSETGVTVTQEAKENTSPWSDFQRALSTGQALVLYMDKTHAVIFPKEQIGENWSAVVQMISTHIPPDKVRIRQVN